MKKEVLTVHGMSCAHCEARVNTALLGLNGVKDSKANAKKSFVKVKYDENEVNLDQMKSAIKELGYEVE